MTRFLLFPLLFSLLLAGCADISPQARRQQADSLAVARGWKKSQLATRDFDLVAYARADAQRAEVLTVYLEGDGMAWLSPAQASDDPTPLNAIGLQLALAHPQGNAAYLARPCQFATAAQQRGCDPGYWTGRRFAPPVVDASMQAIDALKQRHGAQKLVLVGYSGGGAVAALLAARRTDVVGLVTVAGNLDHLAWTRLHEVPPLQGSLSPADDWEALAHLPQLHFVGGHDAVIPVQVTQSFQARFPAGHRPPIRVIQDFSHSCCWASRWSSLWADDIGPMLARPATSVREPLNDRVLRTVN
ncbi:MAG: conserved hypothetical transrane protein [Paucimonas sp.]|nr:conserved hypothetical transrane protein [Paucimonas sp.]